MTKQEMVSLFLRRVWWFRPRDPRKQLRAPIRSMRRAPRFTFDA